MTPYLFTFLMIAIPALFFTTKTESSRILTIQRPMVITQERKTPAFFAYQQTQRLQEINKKTVATLKVAPTTYLSNLSLSELEIKIEVTEMQFNKKEFWAPNLVGTSFASQRAARRDADRAVSSVSATSPTRNYIIENKTYERAFAKESAKNSVEDAVEDAATGATTKKWATIRGKFELVGGVGIVDHYIELKRIEEGQAREIGRIDLKAGLYSIDIESPGGFLIAQIKDRAGHLIGEDRARLINLLSRGTFYEGPFLRVGQPQGVATNPQTAAGGGRTASAGASASYARTKTAVAAAKTQELLVTLFNNQNKLESAEDVFTNISRYSSTISRVFDPSRIYKNVTSIRHTGEKSETALFTTKWMEGVVSYISDVQKIEFKSKNGPVIIGRVMQNSKSLAGATVQIASAPGLAPIYFDQFMIPNFTQTGTSENGYFMFVGLEPNNYQIVATRQDVVLGGQMFIAENDAVAFQNISSENAPRTKIVRSFDAFTSAPIATELAMIESEEVLEIISGSATFKTFSENSVAEYLTSASDKRYLPIRYTQNSSQEYVHLPMIQEQWINAAADTQKIISDPNSGSIIGFTGALIYDAYLVVEDYSKNSIVYFDSLGNITSAPVAGGGFILFNVPTGAHEVILQERNTEKIYSQVFNVQAEQVSAAHFSAE